MGFLLAGRRRTDCLPLLVLVQRLLGLVVSRLEVEDDLLHGAGKGVWSSLLVGAVDDQAIVAANVHAAVAGKTEEDRLVHPTLADLLPVRVERDHASRRPFL